MELIKRYVIELAADRKRDLHDCLQFAAAHDLEENIERCTEDIEKIDTILNQCKYGYISNYEAVRQIMAI